MTREERLKFEIQEQKEVKSFVYKKECEYQDWRYEVERKIADLEKQLAESVEVYEPIYLSNVGKCVYATEHEKYIDNKYIERHNAGEELKKIISEENAKQGWKVDWTTNQDKYYIYYDHEDNLIKISINCVSQSSENELYFSEQSSKDQDFLAKIKPLWLKWKGIEVK